MMFVLFIRMLLTELPNSRGTALRIDSQKWQPCWIKGPEHSHLLTLVSVFIRAIGSSGGLQASVWVTGTRRAYEITLGGGDPP